MPHIPFTILAVDDDPEDLELLEDALLHQQPDTNLMKLINGKLVLPYLDSLADIELPCLIILDYNMPEMTGSQVIRQLCQSSRYQPIPKIILSTSNAALHIEECISNGATSYFVKPNNLHDLNQLTVKMLSFCKPN